DIALGELPVQHLRVSGHETKYDARIVPGEPVNERGNEARGQKGGSSNPQSPRRRVREKRDVLHALAQVIEYGSTAIQQGAAILGRLDALAMAVEQANAERLLQFTD